MNPPPIFREDLVRFHLSALEHATSDLKLKLQQHAGSFMATDSWKAHVQEEIELTQYMADRLRELLPSEPKS